jgi:outer membrane protein TolC
LKISFYRILHIFIISILSSFTLCASENPINSFAKNYLINHFEIKSSNLQVEESRANFKKAKGEFDLKLDYSFSYNKQNTPVSSSLDTQGNTSSVFTKTTTNSLSLSKQFSYGTKISLPYSYNIIDSDSSYRTIRKSYEPTLSFTLKQPIIRPFFNGYYLKKLASAENEYQITKDKKSFEKSEKLYSLIEKVFKYLEEEKSFSIREKSLKTAKDSFNFVRAKKKLGSASKLDLLDSQTSYLKSQERLFQQEIKLFKTRKELDSLTQLESIEIPTILEKDLLGSSFKCECNEEKMYQIALQNRGDYQSSQLSLELKKNLERYSTADRLPKLDLNLDYSSSSIKENLKGANSELFKREYPTYKVATSLSYNLFQYAEKGAQRASELKKEQDLIKVQQQEKDLRMEIQVSIKNYKTQKAVVESLKKSLEAENFKWEFYTKKFKQGQISSFDYAKHTENMENSELDFYKGIFKLERDYYKLFLVQGILLENLIM